MNEKHPKQGKNPAVLNIVIPCYNEEKVLPLTAPMFLKKLNALIEEGLIDNRSRIMFVNDGSRDKTWQIICDLAKDNPHYMGIAQSRNRGHQNAVLAGLMESMNHCDITISIDCDGQDDINAMDEMIKAYYDGCEVVYGVRDNRETDTAFKRFTAQSFYKFMNSMGAEVVYNHADYRLLSNKVLNALSEYKEVNLFLRGMIPLVGFRSTSVYYKRSERLAGESHYPVSTMLRLAIDGITSLSVKPIHFIAVFGMFICLLSFALMIWSIIRQLTGHTVVGWASTSVIICFLGGIQIMSLGVIGEYIGKIYMEVKGRPRYIISERTDAENQ